MGKTVPHIAIVLHVMDDPELERQVALWTEACRRQLLEHVVPSWGGWAPAPGVFFYGAGMEIPAEAAGVIGIMHDAMNPEAGGYHAAIGNRVFGAVDLSRSAMPSRTLSHEVCEMFRNAYLDEWLPGPVEGRHYAAELCDPCQRQDYTIEVDILGEKAEVTVGDFLLPAWFGLSNNPAAPIGMFQRTWCSSVYEAFEIAPGGYQIALEGDSILYLPARGDAVARASIERPLSRTKAISNRITIPRGAP